MGHYEEGWREPQILSQRAADLRKLGAWAGAKERSNNIQEFKHMYLMGCIENRCIYCGTWRSDYNDKTCYEYLREPTWTKYYGK